MSTTQCIYMPVNQFAIEITRRDRTQYLRHTLTNRTRKFVNVDGERWTVRGIVIGEPDFVTADHEQE